MNVNPATNSNPAPQGEINDHSPLKQKQLEPFKDYPSYHLEHYSPEQAAQFIVGYVCGHIKDSPEAMFLEGKTADEFCKASVRLDHMREKMALAFGGKYVSDSLERTGYLELKKAWGKDEFIAITDIAAAERMGNCAEFAYLGARALKEFGCLHTVSVLQVDATLADGRRATHNLLKINDGNQAWCADPFLHALDEPMLKEYFGSTEAIACWPAENANGSMNALDRVHAIAWNTGSTYQTLGFIPLREIMRKNADGTPAHAIRFVGTIFEVERTNNGEITLSAVKR